MSIDILLSGIRGNMASNPEKAVELLKSRYKSLSDDEALEICRMIAENQQVNEKVELAATTPPSFSVRVKPTKIVVRSMIEGAKRSILITGYSLSDYFEELTECIIEKSQRGIFVKFFVNDVDHQDSMDRLLRYRGRFLKVYNYTNTEDRMAALHAKVISVDSSETLITSANLSYHGQEGNIELGTHIISRNVAKQVDDVFTNLIFSKVFTEVKSQT